MRQRDAQGRCSGCQRSGHHERPVRLDIPALCENVGQLVRLRGGCDLEPGWQPVLRVGALHSLDPLGKVGLAKHRLVVVAEREHGVHPFHNAASEPELPPVDERVFERRPRSRADQIKLASRDAHHPKATPESPNQASRCVSNTTLGLGR